MEEWESLFQRAPCSFLGEWAYNWLERIPSCLLSCSQNMKCCICFHSGIMKLQGRVLCLKNDLCLLFIFCRIPTNSCYPLTLRKGKKNALMILLMAIQASLWVCNSILTNPFPCCNLNSKWAEWEIPLWNVCGVFAWRFKGMHHQWLLEGLMYLCPLH